MSRFCFNTHCGASAGECKCLQCELNTKGHCLLCPLYGCSEHGADREHLLKQISKNE